MGLPQGGRRCLGNSNCGCEILHTSRYSRGNASENIGIKLDWRFLIPSVVQITNDFPPLPNSTGNLNVMEIAHKLGGWSARRGEQISQFTENPYISFFWTPSASMSGARCNLHSEGRILHLALSHLVRFFIEWVGSCPQPPEYLRITAQQWGVCL